MIKKPKQNNQQQTELKTYLSKINPVIQRLIVDLLIDRPQDYIQFSIQWLNEKGRNIASGKQIHQRPASYKPDITVKETPNYDFQPEPKIVQVGTTIHLPKPVKSAYLSDSEEQGQDQEHVDELEIQQFQEQKQNTRSSVSAEAYGAFNKKGEGFVPRVIPKNQGQKERILQRLLQSFMFQNLDEKERDIVLGALEEKQYNAGDYVIQQGEDGEVLYIVDAGELDCTRVFKKGQGPKHLRKYQPGDSFGELALLYNAPRAATITATTESVLFALDRATFNNIVKDASQKKRERYEKVLAQVELLAEMDPYERLHVCDGIKQKQLKAQEIVINQGENGDIFYMVDEGELSAFKQNESGEQIEVLKYKSGDYFGELALLKNQPRSATVQAITDCTLVYLESRAFHKLLGPIEEILKRNASKYQELL